MRSGVQVKILTPAAKKDTSRAPTYLAGRAVARPGAAWSVGRFSHLPGSPQDAHKPL